MLLACLPARATDLHIEPKEGWSQLRMRVDGVMVDAAGVPEEIGQRLVGVVKICSDIDPSQKNIVQEGHFSCRLPIGPLRPVINTRAGGLPRQLRTRGVRAEARAPRARPVQCARPSSPT